MGIVYDVLKVVGSLGVLLHVLCDNAGATEEKMDENRNLAAISFGTAILMLIPASQYRWLSGIAFGFWLTTSWRCYRDYQLGYRPQW